MSEVPQQPRLQILAQFVRDLSFENIAARDGTAPEGKPDIKVNVGIDANRRTQDNYDVALKLNVDASVGERKIFLLEMDYVGRFVVQNVPENQLHPFLLIECPRLLFPFLRRIVSDVTRDGGFPPLNIDNIDFVALYRQEVERRRAAQSATGGEGSDQLIS
ncbi:MAG: protein-export protein SecB [Paracoccaceae bacterium]|nr:MAG: protein-export protein SecB [Paracoccaceae bacterium]